MAANVRIGGKADIGPRRFNVRLYPKRTLTDFRFDLDQIQGRCAQTIVNGGCTLRWRPASSGLPVTRRICRSDLADADEPT
jgi:hypothetical protein